MNLSSIAAVAVVLNQLFPALGAPLIALMKDVDGPNDEGVYGIYGTAWVRFNNAEYEGQQGSKSAKALSATNLLGLDMVGLPVGGTVCVQEVSRSGEGFCLQGTNKSYKQAGGIGQSAMPIDGELTSMKLAGKRVQVKDVYGNVVASGKLKKLMKGEMISARIRKYPGYDGDLNAKGIVRVIFKEDGTFQFQYKLRNLEEDCKACGIHIHAGISCETVTDPLGHGWNKVLTPDLWTAEGGAIYYSDNNGKARGSFPMYTGFNKYETWRHAVVVHAEDGTRIGCGTLRL